MMSGVLLPHKNPAARMVRTAGGLFGWDSEGGSGSLHRIDDRRGDVGLRFLGFLVNFVFEAELVGDGGGTVDGFQAFGFFQDVPGFLQGQEVGAGDGGFVVLHFGSDFGGEDGHGVVLRPGIEDVIDAFVLNPDIFRPVFPALGEAGGIDGEDIIDQPGGVGAGVDGFAVGDGFLGLAGNRIPGSDGRYFAADQGLRGVVSGGVDQGNVRGLHPGGGSIKGRQVVEPQQFHFNAGFLEPPFLFGDFDYGEARPVGVGGFERLGGGGKGRSGHGGEEGGQVVQYHGLDVGLRVGAGGKERWARAYWTFPRESRNWRASRRHGL